MAVQRYGPRRAHLRRTVLPWLCTAILLSGIGIDRFLLSAPTIDATAYHQRVRQAANAIPYHFEKWLGVDAPVPTGAVRLLKPNVIVSRRYQELVTGRTATVMLVHCADARDILGHYPPVCYPGQGWRLEVAEPCNWRGAGMEIHGTRYVFNSFAEGTLHAVTVDNFMVLPDGRTVRNMDEVEVAARDSQRKHFGAAQVQLVYGPNLSEADRTELRETFVRMLQPVVETIARRSTENSL